VQLIRTDFDVIIVGAGPAGLSAALILGRCRRSVLICDTGRPRNRAAKHMHGFLSRDGINPIDFLQTCREELAAYENVHHLQIEVVDITCLNAEFTCVLADDLVVTARKAVLATGMVDMLPPIPDIEKFYGISVFHCPYCDGYERRDQALAVYGNGDKGRELALELLVWSKDIVLCTDGKPEISHEHMKKAEENGIRVCDKKIARLSGKDGNLEAIEFEDGSHLPRQSMFFIVGEKQHSELPRLMGCSFNDNNAVVTKEYEATHIPGLYVIGDASRRVQLAIIAAAEGAAAAFAVNTALLREDLKARKV
jgi:thioredoxin reductase